MQIKIIIGVIVTIVLSVLLSLGAGHYNSLRKAAAENEHRGGVLTATTAGVEVGQQNDAEQARTDAGIAQGRQEFVVRLEEGKRNEPDTAVRADRPVPASVRAAYSERRRARERLGCAGGQCEEGR